ncbi:MAG: ISNCY family transposase [Pseudomonadales bacterium]|jgi:transposase|nr:ISNCY family transposase [Pseudomonadales bacterium]
MTEPELGMSEKELKRYGVLERLKAGGVNQEGAAKELGLSVRQVRRLLRRLEAEGPAGLRSVRRGRMPNNRISEARRQEVIALIRAHYTDFGPTLAAEMLATQHGVTLSVETIRTLMRHAGLWKARRRTVRFHPPRMRRPRRGELIQIDGSPHDWFEGRAPRCTLLVFVDDATSGIQAARFVAAETTLAYLELVGDYLTRHGIPQAFYSDKHSIFRVNNGEKPSSTQTQFHRAMDELGIECICAHSPQAKGRVERANGILQDRLVKLMRVAGLSSWEEGNAFLPHFLEEYNARFARTPHEPEDAHVPLDSRTHLRSILCLKETRKLSRQLTCQYHQQWLHIFAPKGQERRLVGASVEVCTHLDDSIDVLHQGRPLSYEFLNTRPQPPVVDAKGVQAMSARHRKPAAHHPWRNPALYAASQHASDQNSASP